MPYIYEVVAFHHFPLVHMNPLVEFRELGEPVLNSASLAFIGYISHMMLVRETAIKFLNPTTASIRYYSRETEQLALKFFKNTKKKKTTDANKSKVILFFLHSNNLVHH